MSHYAVCDAKSFVNRIFKHGFHVTSYERQVNLWPPKLYGSGIRGNHSI